ncbi:MAG: HsdM family class I SAM-dependent methyltransferase [Candidatus Njordarchaeia archaeon]
MIRRGRITERSLYPVIKRVFEEHGAKAVTEIRYVSLPDLIVDWLGEYWIVSIKIGDPKRPKVLRDAFMQYISHMQDSGIKYGMIIFYPEEIREIEPSNEAIEKAVRNNVAYFIVLNPQMELRDSLPVALDKIEEILRESIPVSFTLPTVVALLRAHIEELIERGGVSGRQVMKIISDPELFFGINPMKGDEMKRLNVLRKVSTFLATYIFLSQVLFLRLYCEDRPTLLGEINIDRLTYEDVNKLFDRIKNINYRPIFDINVLNFIPENLIQDTFKLLFGLQVKNIRYELPGRLFHELMPKKIRKLLAAFYTRPIAAFLLAQLTIDDADASVFDPACGSGTILTMAYRRKLELWKENRRLGNPHKQFCEEQIYGCDIMPFAVHLTNANLAAMDPLSTIEFTQVALGDSLKLVPSTRVPPGFISLMDFISTGNRDEVKANGFRRTGETVEITLRPVDVILMNPPFTKVERGIRKYIDTSKFEDVVGRGVGLWGHFIALADAFLKDGGMFGAVLPINLIRGKESAEVRKIIFQEWLPFYVIKASKNYGFSEYAEYRDILVVAKKVRKKPRNHKVKFCIIKKDLNKLEEEEAKWIAEQIKRIDSLRSELLDIDSYSLDEITEQFDNMMPFISGPSLEGKDALRRIISEAEKLFSPFPPNYFKEGFGPRPKGVSGFLFITQSIGEGRTQEAFLTLEKVVENKIIASTPSGVQIFEFEKKHFLPSLRTPVGISRMDVTEMHDYVAKEPYENFDKVIKLSSFEDELPENYWVDYINTEFKRSRSHVAVVRRINPYSPNQMLIAYYSDEPLILANVFHAVNEDDKNRAKAMILLLNSIFFLAYFFNIKEETTGRYTELRHYDLYKIKLYPTKEQVKRLINIYKKYKDKEFPPLREQLDIHFNERYEWFWEQEKGEKKAKSPPPIKPHKLRLEFDTDVIKAVGANLTKDDLLKAYEAIVLDMIITRGLRRD